MAHALGYLRAGLGSARSGTRERFAKRSRVPLPALSFVFVLLCGALAGPLLHAQAPAIQSVRFTVFSAKPVTDLAFVPQANAPAQALKFYPTARSPRYEYRGVMPLRFVDAVSGAIVAEATLPLEMRDALLLFSPVAGTPKTGALRYQVAVLDDSALRHGPGGLAVINLSGLSLTGTVGNQAVTLTPGLNPTLAVGRSAKIALRTTFKNRSYQAYADTVQLTAKQRALLILFPPFYQGSLEVQSRLLIDEPPGAAGSPLPKK